MQQHQVNEVQILLKAVGYLRTHWWLFVIEIIAVYAVSLHSFYKTPSVYESDTTLLIDSSRRQLYQSIMMTSLNNSNNNRKQNMVHLLTSEEVMDRFRTAFNDYYNTEGRPIHLRAFFPLGNPAPISTFRSMISLNWNKDSDIYNIHCTANNPDSAHNLCLIYLNTIQSYYPEIGQRDVLMKRDFLSRQITSFISQIKERENNLIAFQKKNSDFFNFITSNLEEKGLQKLRIEHSTLKRRLASNRAIYKLILSLPHAKKGELTARSTIITVLTARITELEYQLQLTEQSNDIDKNDKLQHLRSEYQSVSSRLAKLNDEDVTAYMKNPIPTSEVRRKVAELELEYRTDLIRIQSSEHEIEALSNKEKEFNQQRLEYERLYMELNHKKKLLTNLYQKEQESELELSAGNAEIFRLQEPTRNGHRTAPQLSKHIYGAGSMSMFFILCSTILLILFFPRIDSEAEVQRLNLPILGKVPVISKGWKTIDEIPSYGLEYLKIMNYRINRETKDTKCPVIVISSPHAREGKSTISHLLTLVSQSTDKKILLIDGDLLTAHPNSFFGHKEDATIGFVSLLEGATQKPLKELITKTDYESIFFLPRGARLDPTSLPNFIKLMERTISELRKQFDIIYIDTPPLFASNLAHQWSSFADLIILVARLYSTRAKDIQEAIQTCKIFTKAPVGIALNGVRLTGLNRKASNYYFSKRKATAPTKVAA